MPHSKLVSVCCLANDRERYREIRVLTPHHCQTNIPMNFRASAILNVACWLLFFAISSSADSLAYVPNFAPTDDARSDADDLFAQSVQQYISTYCIECHQGDKAKGDLDLSRYQNSSDVIQNFRTWNHIVEFIQNGEMPPRDSKQPSIDENNSVAKSVANILIAEAKKRDGDPGPVLPRRLSNTEYDNSVRDLTGIHIRPTKDFPPDPAGGEGFDNTGESLGISPNLLKKYLATAQLVSDHLVLRTDGIAFSPFPITSYNERRKLTEEAIIDFYNQHSVDLEKYIEAAWRFRFRPSSQSAVTIESWAQDRGLSSVYLPRVANFLDVTLPKTASYELAFAHQLATQWQQLAAPESETSTSQQIRDFVQSIELLRNVLTPPERELIQSNAGNWPINHLDFRAKVAASRDQFETNNLKATTILRSPRISNRHSNASDNQTQKISIQFERAFSNDDTVVIIQQAIFSNSDQWPNNPTEYQQHQAQSFRSVLEASAPELASSLRFGNHLSGTDIDAESFAVQVPNNIEIAIPAKLAKQLDGKHLLMKCQLDTSHNRNGNAFADIQYNTRAPRSLGRNAKLLIEKESDLTKSVSQFATDFCDTFPNRFYYVDSGRGLAAGFHLVEGFFRDDQPLVNKVLSEAENVKLNKLWREIDFVTESAETLLRGFVWFERAEREVLLDKRFDFLSSEDPKLVEDSMLERFEKVYLDKMGVQRIEDTLEPVNRDAKFEMIHGFFEQIRHGLAEHKSLLALAEPKALLDIEAFASRAYRRKLSDSDRESLHTLYRELRADGLDIEPALRGLVTAILMSPDFFLLYRETTDGKSVSLLPDNVIATRLSYFLWSSLPDEALLAAASSGDLTTPDQIAAQTLRMLDQPQVQSFAREFFGQWLRYRDFIEKDPINAAAFPGYDEELRLAMAEEPVQLATRLIQLDRPITDLLNSDTTMVNARLAKHYGPVFEQQYREELTKFVRSQTGDASDHTPNALATADANKSPWLPVRGLRQSGRGGLFGMAVVLAKNSAGERTSPVKRGFWSVHHLLGQHFPPPPADVPELPKSEATSEKTIRELLALHVADEQCARCHKHFDGLGLAMEGFDATGRARTVDSAGRPIDNVATLPGGNSAQGISGLIDYVEKQRRDDFVRTFCRKFLGYALGRSVLLSDQPLLDEMERQLVANEYRFSSAFITVVRSQQFRYQRSKDFSPSGL